MSVSCGRQPKGKARNISRQIRQRFGGSSAQAINNGVGREKHCVAYPRKQDVPRFTLARFGALGNVLEDRQQGVADATKNHDKSGQSGIVRDPGSVVLLEGVIEDLMRRFDSPVSTDDGEPLLRRQSVGGQAGKEVEGFVSRLTMTVEAVAVDTNDCS